MSYKVLAFDIDGTLTDSQKKITPRTKAAIGQAAKQGCKIVIASGRPVRGLQSYAKELHLKEIGGYLLSLNGALLIACKDGRIIQDVRIPAEYYGEICDLAKACRVRLMTYQGDEIVSETPQDPYLQIEKRINGLGLIPVADLKSYLTFSVSKFLMLGDGAHLAEVEKTVSARLKNRLEVYRSEPFFLEILPKGINKASALEKLLEETACKREELMAFGDGFNDLTMIRYAGMGVAMENGVQVVKDAADYIAPSNDADGIAEVLEKFVLDRNTFLR